MHIYMCVPGDKKMMIFRKILRMYQMNDPFAKYAAKHMVAAYWKAFLYVGLQIVLASRE